MGLRVSLLLILTVLVACGKSSDDGDAAESKAVLIEPVSIQGNFQNQPLDSQPQQPAVVQTQPATIQTSQPQQQTASAARPADNSQPAQFIQADLRSDPSQKPFKPANTPPVLDEEVEQLVTLDDSPTTAQPRATETVPLPKPKPTPVQQTKPQIKTAPAGDSLTELEKELLRLINEARAKKRIAPVKFSRAQSNGTAKCVGSQGHSEHMARTRNMSHDQFPADICLRTMASSENVGYADGDAFRALGIIHKMMMDEGPGGGHYEHIMNPTYNTVGLGFYYDGGRRLWMTENFLRL